MTFTSTPASLDPTSKAATELTARSHTPTVASVEDPSVSQLFSLKGRTSIVTGGARGLGITLASALLESGSHVYCVDISPEPSPKEWAALVVKADELKLVVKYRKLDITDAEAVGECFKGIAAEAPEPVRVLLGAAGIQHECPAVDYKINDFRRVMDVNVTGTFNTAQAACRVMMEHGMGGSIALIASMSGSVANRGLSCAAYNASKSALLQLARSTASEWGPHKIRVNTISPGYIMTAMTAQLIADRPDDKLEERWANDNMMGRVSLPWEYKGPAIFLASDASAFCTGMDLRVDGGHCAW